MRRRAARLALPALLLATALPAATALVPPIAPAAAASAAPGARLHSAGACQVVAHKTLGPERVVLGATAQVTLTVDAECAALAAPLHLALVVDNSTDIGGPRLEGLREAVAVLPEVLDFEQSQAGLVVFHSTAEILAPLSHDPQALVEASRRFFPRQGHNLKMGLRAGLQLLRQARPGAAPGVTEVLLVVVAGPSDHPAEELLAEAQQAKDEGVLVVTVGASGLADYALLEAMATAPSRFYTETYSGRYATLFREIIGDIGRVTLTGAQVTDSLSTGLGYVWGSGVPAPRVRGADLAWRYAIWPAEGLRISYRMTCDELGRRPSSTRSELQLEFDRGAPQIASFPIPEIDCVPAPSPMPEPTETPTPSPSPTASPMPSATPRLLPVYLPVAWKQHCLPLFERADVALVLDASSSMLEPGALGDPKLQLALDAASAFVDALALPADRAAIVTFSSRAELLYPLSGDRAPLQLALARLFGQVRYGSRLDLGIALGHQVVVGPEHHAESRPVLVLLTDGLAADDAAARAAAERARSEGLLIYAIGLGQAPDRELLAELAGDPARSFLSPDGADLRRIYLQIARASACGAPLAP